MLKTSVDEFLNALQLAEKSVSRERQQRLFTIDLTIAQAQILKTLHRLGPISLSDLNAELPTDVPPSRVVSTLVDRRLVTRRDQVTDRRHVELALSKLGQKKVVKIRRVERAVQRWAAKRLTRMPVKAAQKALSALGRDR